MEAAYLPWKPDWREVITYIPWFQPEAKQMADSPVLPAYPVIKTAVEYGAEGEELLTAVAGAMLAILGHQPGDPLAPLYSVWLLMYDPALPQKLLLEGTELASHFDFGEAIWMLQASLMLEPESHEAHYNLGRAYEQLGLWLQKQQQTEAARRCLTLAAQYRQNAEQLKGRSGPACEPEFEPLPLKGENRSVEGEMNP